MSGAGAAAEEPTNLPGGLLRTPRMLCKSRLVLPCAHVFTCVLCRVMTTAYCAHMFLLQAFFALLVPFSCDPIHFIRVRFMIFLMSVSVILSLLFQSLRA